MKKAKCNNCNFIYDLLLVGKKCKCGGNIIPFHDKRKFDKINTFIKKELYGEQNNE